MDYGKSYKQVHMLSARTFSGYSIKYYVPEIAALVLKTQSKTLLDYGSGKGYQYLERRVHETWGGILPTCYDPGVRQLDDRPKGTFHGVICTDVMEHIETFDVQEILKDIMGYATKFAFFGICCKASVRKRLPDGRPVHLTVKPPEWWDDQIRVARLSIKDEIIVRQKFEK